MCAFLIAEIAIFCYHKVATTVPINYILLLICTLSQSWMIGMICNCFIYIIIGGLIGADGDGSGVKLVFIAAALTFSIVTGLTIYAFTTKTDFTTKYLISFYYLGEVFFVYYV